ncbi:Gfo/Idh/MocA family oxidoreductase [Paracoccus sp. DMF-8]|uniref:Gfo/Idh/MocA family protein n=1 Tax=Paracoccus sp. DMF-8 TaxID=3019445 RepID=UPI0023E7A82F|nr:Gfo/Idh/MocA family oxidoreductase [Paracoccus sp. DMF-8]MDF3605267.1 Gfo/Idh/MocA family oxidoreductase [Paracoccus sp. DMF-8]
MSDKPKLRIGLIGTGFMGKAHVFGFAAAPKVFDLPYDIELHTVADVTEQAAQAAARAMGFAHATTDWRRLIDDPAIDVIDITAPNALHKDMALAAIAAGKHVYCEKPLAPWPRTRAKWPTPPRRRGSGRRSGSTICATRCCGWPAT